MKTAFCASDSRILKLYTIKTFFPHNHKGAHHAGRSMFFPKYLYQIWETFANRHWQAYQLPPTRYMMIFSKGNLCYSVIFIPSIAPLPCFISHPWPFHHRYMSTSQLRHGSCRSTFKEGPIDFTFIRLFVCYCTNNVHPWQLWLS